MRMQTIAVGLALLLVAGCSGTDGPQGYLPPNLSSGLGSLTIADVPLQEGGQAEGNFPVDGRYLGFLFAAQDGEVYDIVLQRVSGNDVPALVLYRFEEGWSEALAWASADAQQIGIRGWAVPGAGTYLVLVEVVDGTGDGSFIITLSCEEGCGDPDTCTSNDDCDPGEVCWNGLCFEDQVECQADSDCRPHELCENGFCVAICNPAPEICDGLDNDCDGLVDEDCEPLPCTSDADCPAGEVCMNGLCVPFCGCRSDADCPAGTICLDCQCVEDSCPDQDGDGYSHCQGDCDDLNAAVHPGASEACDNVDNDCDGVVDEGCGGFPCTSDADCAPGELCWDGVCIATCRTNDECPAGQVCMNGICQEICLPEVEICGDNIDNDCDGLVDEDCGLPCSADSDCADGDGCTQGACVAGVCQFAALPDGTACDDGDACTSMDVCIQGRCVGEPDPDCGGCDGDSQCAAGQACCNGLCVDLLFDPRNCGACGAACAAGEYCERGVCMGGCGCLSDADCDDGDPATVEYCLDCMCISEPLPCTSDSDCPAGLACEGGICTQPNCYDLDGDGYLGCEGDCDDYDPSIHPGAVEVCDNQDNDCDGQVDEGCPGGCAADDDCAAGQVCCANVCVDPFSDPENCGACGSACAAGETCYGGACTLACTSDADCDDGDPATWDACINGVCEHR